MTTDLVIINHSGWAGLMVHVIQELGLTLFVVFVPCIPSLKLTFSQAPKNGGLPSSESPEFQGSKKFRGELLVLGDHM